MGLSFAEICGHLERLGSAGKTTSDGRVYHVVPVTHRCGEGVFWLIRVDHKNETAENLGAFCESCKRRAVPSLQLLSSQVIIASMEQRAAELEKAYEGNKPWFASLMESRLGAK